MIKNQKWGILAKGLLVFTVVASGICFFDEVGGFK